MPDRLYCAAFGFDLISMSRDCFFVMPRTTKLKISTSTLMSESMLPIPYSNCKMLLNDRNVRQRRVRATGELTTLLDLDVAMQCLGSTLVTVQPSCLAPLVDATDDIRSNICSSAARASKNANASR